MIARPTIKIAQGRAVAQICVFLTLIAYAATGAAQTGAAQTGAAQKPAAQPTPEPVKNDSRKAGEKELSLLQQRAATVLDQLAEKSKEIGNPGFRVRVTARIGEAVWDYNESRGQQILEDAFRSISAIEGRPQIKTLLRNEVLGLISRRNPDLAEKLIKSLNDSPSDKQTETKAPASPASPASPAAPAAQSALYLRTAMAIVDTNPTRAAQMIKLSIDGGLYDQRLIIALLQIREKNLQLANELFRYALLRAQPDPNSPPTYLAFFAAYAIPGYERQYKVIGAGIGDPPDPSLAPACLGFAKGVLERRFSLIGNGEGKPEFALDYLIAQSLLPYFDQFLPAGSPAFRGGLTGIAANVPHRDEVDSLFSATLASDLLAKAEKATGPQKDQLYQQAAYLALEDKEPDKALSIARQIADDKMRSDLESVIRFEATRTAVTQDDYDGAYAYAKDLPDLQMRALAFNLIANALYTKNQSQRALEVLRDAELLIGKAEKGPTKARAVLALAGTVVRIDALRGFEVMATAVQEINRTELTLQPNGMISTGSNPNPNLALDGTIGMNIFNFNDGFSLLARRDFDRALLLAQSLERKEASVLAQLAVCRSVLSNPDEGRKTSANPDQGQKKEAGPGDKPDKGPAKEKSKNKKSSDPH